jgi:polyhydroxybutyrate depolymerase
VSSLSGLAEAAATIARFVRLGWVPFVLAALAAATALAPARAEAPGRALAASGCGSPHPAGSFRLTLNSAGETRYTRVHVPPDAPTGRQLPLVLAFSGAGATGAFMQRQSGLSHVADRNGFIVAYPSSFGKHPFWSLNDDAPNGPQDLRFVNDLLDRLEATLCVDTGRVYATGVSNGGGFTARMGCEVSSRLAAIAPVAGGYKAIPDCDPDRPVSVLEIHGTNDGAVPYHGVPPDFRGSVPLYVQGWRTLDKCGQSAVGRLLARGITQLTWSGCAGGTVVSQIKLYGRGHEWPGAFGAPGFSAAQAVWSFLQGRRRVAIGGEPAGATASR